MISPPLLTTVVRYIFGPKKLAFYFMPEWVEKIHKKYFSSLYDKIQVFSKEIALAAFNYLFSKNLFQFTKHVMSSEFLQKCG